MGNANSGRGGIDGGTISRLLRLMREGHTPSAAARACNIDRKTAVRYRALAMTHGPSLVASRCPQCGSLPESRGQPCRVCDAREGELLRREIRDRLVCMKRAA